MVDRVVKIRKPPPLPLQLPIAAWSTNSDGSERLVSYDGVRAKDLTEREVLALLKLQRFERALAELACVHH